MPSKVSTHLMFEGDAEEAMNFYVSIFGNLKIIEVKKYQAETGTISWLIDLGDDLHEAFLYRQTNKRFWRVLP
jgi:predicted 3-demethylubiquinone-9 3-methyltransferase (glyoxalase superfamily)